MQCFIGLTFSGNYLQYRKIDYYRQRFDFKYSKSNVLQLTLLPTFSMESFSSDFFECLEDEIEGHLSGVEGLDEIYFAGVDLDNDRKGNIFLKPEIPLELEYCQQSLWELIKEQGGNFKKKTPLISPEDKVLRTLLPIGRTAPGKKGLGQLETAFLKAKEEFEKPFKLKVDGIAFFEITPGQWLLKKYLHLFDERPLEFNERECLEGQIQALYV